MVRATKVFALRGTLFRMTDIFDVLSDETRRKILWLLHEKSSTTSAEVSVSQLVSQTGHSQPSISKQLKILREVGLVTVREDGQHRLYQLDPKPLTAAKVWLSAFSDVADIEKTSSAPAPPPRGIRGPSVRVVAPPRFLVDIGRELGAAAADLAAKAPWR